MLCRHILLGAGIMLAAAMGLSAAEFLVTDHTFTFTESEHGFHYFDAASGAPSNWKSPDDYWNGTWSVRYEVISYPSSGSKGFKVQTCIWADVVGNYSSWKEQCTGYSTCSDLGVFTQSSTPSAWWKMNNVPVDFARPGDFKTLGMVLRKTNDCIISDWGSWCWSERADYLPMQMRLTIVLTSAGSTFSGWENYVGGVVSAQQEPRVDHVGKLSRTGLTVKNLKNAVRIEAGQTPATLVLYNARGETVHAVSSNTGSLSISKRILPRGVYTGKVTTESSTVFRTLAF